MSEQNVLHGACVYHSGPMDFVASRADEKKLGWRNRIGDFLRAQGAIVFDPWFKPGVRGAQEYGLEDVHSVDTREQWTFAQGQAGDEARSECAEKFWETLHIDLRMVDTSDFTIAYVPTNIYSVGTVHEIVLSRLQWKPVLFVSPPVTFPSLELLRGHLEARQDVQEIFSERFTVSEKIDSILQRVATGNRLRFSDLFGEAASRVEVVVTFLALLELIRLRQVRAVQKNVFEEIEIAAATA